MSILRKVTRFRSMGWSERFSQISWYLRFPFVLAGRLLLLGIYFPAAFGLSRFRIRFLVNRVVGENFGHLALDPSLYVMSGEIYGRTEYRNVMMLSPSKLSNRALFRYWVSHFTVIDNPLTVFLMTPFTWFPFIARQIYLRDLVITNRSGKVDVASFADADHPAPALHDGPWLHLPVRTRATFRS